MAYNYSPWHLTNNADTVRWLVELAKHGEAGSKSFQHWKDAKIWREDVLSLLACLAYNHPELAWVKNTLRTWIDRTKDGLVTVGVGPEAKAGRKLRGPRPHAIETGIREAEVLEIQELRDSNDLIKLAVLLTGKVSQTTAKIIIPPSPEGIEYLRNVRNEESGLCFQVVSVEPHLILRVASANDALASQDQDHTKGEASP